MNSKISFDSIIFIGFTVIFFTALCVATCSSSDKESPKKEFHKQKESARTEIAELQPKFINGDGIVVIGGFYKGSWGTVRGISVNSKKDTTYLVNIADLASPTEDCPGWYDTRNEFVESKFLKKKDGVKQNKSLEQLKSDGECDN